MTSEVRGLTNANHERCCPLADTVLSVQHDAEVWRQAAAFVDEQREDFDGDLRQVRDRMRDHADWVAGGLK